MEAATQRMKAAMRIAAEASASAVEQATAPTYFFNWAAPVIEDMSEAEEIQGDL